MTLAYDAREPRQQRLGYRVGSGLVEHLGADPPEQPGQTGEVADGARALLAAVEVRLLLAALGL